MLKNLSLKQLCALLFLLATFFLGLAFIIEYFFKFPPCILCIYQRYAYFTLALFAGIGYFCQVNILRQLFLWMCIVSLFFGATVALYHSGVERHIFAKPTECSTEVEQKVVMSEADIRAQLTESNQMPSCDIIMFAFLGLSLANINAIFSLLISFLTCWKMFHLRKKYKFF